MTYINKPVTPPWYESRRAPGTPTTIEALFYMAVKRPESAEIYAFKKYGLTKEEFWQCRGAWNRGQVHELVRQKVKCGSMVELFKAGTRLEEVKKEEDDDIPW